MIPAKKKYSTFVSMEYSRYLYFNPFIMKNLLFALIAIMLTLPCVGQSKSSKKNLTAKLKDITWKVFKTWNGRQGEENKPTEWTEVSTKDSKHAYYFGANEITLKANGTFAGTLLKGEKFSGTWNTKNGLTFVYKDADGYDHSIHYETVQFTSTGFTASGDICNDGCLAKVEFQKVK
jgi:hypothetical protein